VPRERSGSASDRRLLEGREPGVRQAAARVGEPVHPLYASAERGGLLNFETTATRIWKRLTREERLAAARRFFEEPADEALVGVDLAIVKARRMRPQAARALPAEEKARAVASVLEPGEVVASALLVALHVGERRPLLAAFLDRLGLPHDDGILKEEDVAPVRPISEETARRGVAALADAFPLPQVLAYLNVLWLQDPERWAVLEHAPDWLG